jgi:hypothetical protein
MMPNPPDGVPSNDQSLTPTGRLPASCGFGFDGSVGFVELDEHPKIDVINSIDTIRRLRIFYPPEVFKLSVDFQTSIKK